MCGDTVGPSDGIARRRPRALGHDAACNGSPRARAAASRALDLRSFQASRARCAGPAAAPCYKLSIRRGTGTSQSANDPSGGEARRARRARAFRLRRSRRGGLRRSGTKRGRRGSGWGRAGVCRSRRCIGGRCIGRGCIGRGFEARVRIRERWQRRARAHAGQLGSAARGRVVLFPRRVRGRPVAARDHRRPSGGRRRRRWLRERPLRGGALWRSVQLRSRCARRAGRLLLLCVERDHRGLPLGAFMPVEPTSCAALAPLGPAGRTRRAPRTARGALLADAGAHRRTPP